MIVKTEQNKLRCGSHHVSGALSLVVCHFVLERLCQLLDGLNDNFLEGFAPDGVQLIDFRILRNRELSQIIDKVLRCLSILLCLQSVIFDLLLPIFLALITMRLLLNLWRKDGWG